MIDDLLMELGGFGAQPDCNSSVLSLFRTTGKVEKVLSIFVRLLAYVACFTSCKEKWEPFVEQTGVGAF